ncbi:MAG: hypothetical protein DRI44_08890, partial [Chlamydiae bacterium]
EFAKELVYKRKDVKSWLDGNVAFSQYDGELGWLLKGCHVKDGVDDTWCTYSYENGGLGCRKTINYADKKCRINAYGDSFTQCHQVSDGETWEEILAAHFGELIRNFGVGGWSVYQAYLRMKREEKKTPAEYIIFNIWGDDHFRNLDSWRKIRVPQMKGFGEPTLPYVEVNPETKKFKEYPNPCPTKESVYNLCDIDWVINRFKDDFVFNIMLAHKSAADMEVDKSYDKTKNLATTFGINTKIDSAGAISKAANEMHTRAALYASMRIVELVEDYAEKNNKKILYVLSFGSYDIAKRIKEGTRFDQEFVDFMKEKKLPYVDLMDAHVKDYAKYKISVEDYLKQYYIGHYNPRGNFFHAWAIKDKLVEMLNPKPTVYKK